MILDFQNDTGFELDTECTSAIERVAELTLEIEGLRCEVEISVLIVDNDIIRSLNKKYRKIDATTDVLSFPAYDLTQGDYSILNNEEPPVHIGDIAISIDKALNQSEEYGHTLLRELSFLVVHSILHLLGYDHVTDETEMFIKQGKILEMAGIIR